MLPSRRADRRGHGLFAPPAGSGALRIRAALARAEVGAAEILSVHTSRLGRLSAEEVRRLTAIWSAAGLEAAALLGARAAQPA